MPRTLILLAAALAALMGGAASAPQEAAGQAQPGDFDPSAEWWTLETERFLVHFPANASEWVQPVAERMEAMREAVDAEVGRGPDERVTVVVADPMNQPGGYALPFLDRPLTTLWATPPEPGSRIGTYRDWGELLFIHEYAHLAHLTYPRRDAFRSAGRRLLPVQLSPVTLRSPRWAVEGYATHLEGKLTGSGRPYSATLPAFARQRALEGRLPTYGQLSGAQGFEDGQSAYLLGAAFVQWLAEREGEESLEHVWRRLSARERRSFSDAFSGVYRGPPEELYGEFAVELTARALEAREILEDAGLEKGELRSLRRWATGEPTVSPDGEFLAMTLYQRDAPGRVVVERTDVDQDAVERQEERREELLERDPEDVPAVDWQPPPRETVAELGDVLGRAHHHPRFLPDGSRLLVVRAEPLPDGARSRRDLFIWDFDEDELRRVTYGAGIRQADPSPDGTEAVATQCRWGRCHLVRVDLASGDVTEVAPGTFTEGFHGPRWAPHGEEAVASVRTEDGRWRLVAVPLTTEGEPRFIDPDDGAHRYDAAFLPGEDRLVAVSTRGGVPNLEELDLVTGETRPLTRVVGEAAAPAPGPEGEGIHFLHRHSRGWDVRTIHPEDVDLEVTPLPEALWPAAQAQPDAPPPQYDAAPVPEEEPYGWGPHQRTPLAGGSHQEAGRALHLGVGSSDPIGRASLLAQGALAGSNVWAGGAAQALIRRFALPIRAEAFVARQRPSGEAERTGPLDVRMMGGFAAARLDRIRSRSGATLRMAGSGTRMEGADDGFTRVSAEARVRAALAYGGRLSVRPELHANLEGGRTAGQGWTRIRAGGGANLRLGDVVVGLDGEYGRQSGGPAFEGFRVGGPGTPLFDASVLAQDVPEPVYPTALLQGNRLGAGQVRVGSPTAGAFLRLWSTDPDLSRWHRVAGLEQAVDVGPFPEAGIPTIRARLGVAHSFDDPFRDRTRVYISVDFRP